MYSSCKGQDDWREIHSKQQDKLNIFKQCFNTYLLCYKGLSKTFSGSCVGTVTADICLSGNGLRKLVTTLVSTLLSCLDLKLELGNPASIPGWNLSNRVTILSLSRSLHSLRSFHADGAFSILVSSLFNWVIRCFRCICSWSGIAGLMFFTKAICC
jgi:hypothetical protein